MVRRSRMTQEDRDREAEEADRREAERNKAQRECGHYSCEPTEWWWSGKIREMTCRDCGLAEYRGEDEE